MPIAIIVLFILVGVLMVQQTALARTLRDVRTKQDKSGREIDELIAENVVFQGKVATLQERIASLEAGQEVTQELLDAANAVVEGADLLDNKIPDSPSLPPVTPEEEALARDEQTAAQQHD